MKNTSSFVSRLFAALGIASLAVAMFASLLSLPVPAQAASLVGETFTGASTPSGAWITGGSGGYEACLTAATNPPGGSIPACESEGIDSVGNGVLRLTPAANATSGFAIYDTPVSAAEGLKISFDMYQYAGTGADGISFFLIDGAANPTAPGAAGGALGYASSGITPGLVGGYVGVGFDKYGNYTNSNVGGGGPGASANSIGVRGSEAEDYPYVTHVAAAGNLAPVTSVRATARRHVVVTISTGNIMSVAVDYNNGQGLKTELSAIDLNTINGPGTLPATFKFGFAASTGGSNNNHEISGLSVVTLNPNVSVNLGHTGTFIQGGLATLTATVSNNANAEATSGLVTLETTIPAGLTPQSASGTGWACGIAGQVVSCTRSSALSPGSSYPAVQIPVAISRTAATPRVVTAEVELADVDNDNGDPTDSDSIAILAGSFGDTDGVFSVDEDAAPNSGDANDDGLDDSLQSDVTSFLNPVTSKYSVLESDVCASNTDVSSAAASVADAVDAGTYSYPAGLMQFELTCAAPGDIAQIVQYHYGAYTPANLAMRKFSAVGGGAYATIPGAVFSSVTIGGEAALKIVYQVKDGGPFDEDGLENGVVVDPSGPALLALAPTPTPAVSSSPTVEAAPQAAAPSTGLGAVPLAPYALAFIGAVGLSGWEVRKRLHAKSART